VRQEKNRRGASKGKRERGREGGRTEGRKGGRSGGREGRKDITLTLLSRYLPRDTKVRSMAAVSKKKRWA